MNPVIIIPARMKATRLPDKPLADIHGIPMIVHVWKRAVESGIGNVFVACDDSRIVKAVQDAGGKAVMTGLHHASGSDRIYEALQTIDPDRQHDIVINVQGDVPTIEPESIRAVLEPLNNADYDIATLACKITRAEEKTDPSVVKAILSFTDMRGGTLPPTITGLNFTRANAAQEETSYHHIGIYAYRRNALEKFVSLPPSERELSEKLEQLRALDAGMKIGVAIVDAVPLGVDTPQHLERARQLLKTTA